MATIKSLFGAYADKLQIMVDTAADQFAPTLFERYFDWGIPQGTLSFVTAIGQSRIEAAASIVDPDSMAPLRARPSIEKLSGEVPAISHKFRWNSKEVRDYLTLQNAPISDAAKKTQLLNLLFGDTKRAGDGLMKRVDFMVLEGLSTGSITVTTTNNPDGIVAPTAIDLLLPSANKTQSAVTWNTAATATPITDINTVVEAASSKGRKFAKILMTRSTFLKMAKTTEVSGMLAGFFRLASNQKMNPTLSQMNEYLDANMLPVIEIIDAKIGIEKDGIISTVSAWNENNITFIPDGKLGIIHNAYSVEKIKPVSNVTYADYKNGLISKWSQNEPFTEWTKGELNAFPGFEAIDGISILEAIH